MSNFLQCVAGILISMGLLINCYLLHLQEKRLDAIEKEVMNNDHDQN